MAKIIVNTTEVSVLNLNGEDYICLTDMMKAKDGEFFVTDWLSAIAQLLAMLEYR